MDSFKVKRLVLFFNIFFVLNFYAQTDTLYYDLKKQEINKIKFKNKLDSNFYHLVRYSTDTLVVEALYPNYLFGKLQPKVKSQLFKILNSRHKIDTLKTLSIYDIDTLKLKEEFPRKNTMTFRDSLGNVLGVSKSFGNTFDGRKYRGKAKFHDTEYNYKTFIRYHKSILKKHKRFKNVTPLFFYNYNNGTDLEVGKIKWYKDFGQLIKNIFKYEDRRFVHLVIKPNGEFYVWLGYTRINYRGLFKDKLWDINKKSYFNEISK